MFAKKHLTNFYLCCIMNIQKRNKVRVTLLYKNTEQDKKAGIYEKAEVASMTADNFGYGGYPARGKIFCQGWSGCVSYGDCVYGLEEMR